MSYLFFGLQTAAEFMRLVSVDLHKSFLDGLDKYLPRLIELYRVRDSSTTKLHSLLQSLDVEVSIVDLNLNSLSPLSLTSTKISVVMAFARK